MYSVHPKDEDVREKLEKAIQSNWNRIQILQDLDSLSDEDQLLLNSLSALQALLVATQGPIAVAINQVRRFGKDVDPVFPLYVYQVWFSCCLVLNENPELEPK